MKKTIIALMSIGAIGTPFWQVGIDPRVLQQELLQQTTLLPSSPGYDLESDASLHRFLDEQHPFTDKHYVPEDLEAIPSDFTWNAARKFQLRKEA